MRHPPRGAGAIYFSSLNSMIIHPSSAPCVLLSDLQRFPAVRQRVSSRSRSLSSSSAKLGSPVLFSSLPWPCASGAPAASRADGQSYLVKSSALACSVESPHQPVFELHHWKLASFEQSHRFPLKSGPHRPSVGRAGRFRCGQSNSVRSSAFACSAVSPHQPLSELQNRNTPEQSHLAPSKSAPHRPVVG